jgi:hypothetical protein
MTLSTTKKKKDPEEIPKPQKELERARSQEDEVQTTEQSNQKTKERTLDNWLSSYLHFTRHEESPEMFHLWTGLGVLATVINRNVWMPRKYKRCYPNLYILFTGPSSIGKSSAAEIGVGLLREVKKCPPIFTGSITTPALLKKMSENMVEERRGDILVRKTPILIYASELANLLTPRTGVRELAMLITELFTKEGNHEDTTMSRDIISVVNPNVTAILCCFSGWLAEELPSISLRSGFLGRQCVVLETVKRHHDPEMVELSSDDSKLRKDLINDLELIADAYGEMRFSQEGWEFWKPWYNERPLDLSNEDCEVEGFHGRMPQFILRVAMLLSLSNKHGNMIVTKGDLKAAMALIDNCELATKKLGAPDKAHSQGEVVLRKIANYQQKNNNAPMPLFKLMQKVSREMNKEVLMKVMDQLITAGFIGWNGASKTVRLMEVKKEKEKEKKEEKEEGK